MPEIQPGSLVLVTGASGFVASWVIKELLGRGHRVRGTVRSEVKGRYLQKLFDAGKAFEYVIVEDVERPGTFDEAVESVEGIAHIASPFHYKVTDPHRDLINPAVNGTIGLLESARKFGKDVKRIVITSSAAAVLYPVDPPYTFTEDDWNEHSQKEIETKGKHASASDAYKASKTLAERAAWDFIKNNSPQFDLVTITPPLILGPIIHQVDKPESLNESVSQFYAYLSGKKSAEGATSQDRKNGVDVRDVAIAHVEALLKPEAGNQRFAVSKMPFSWQQALDIVNDLRSSPAKDIVPQAFPNVPRGEPGQGRDHQIVLDASRSKKVLRIRYREFRETIEDMATSLAEREKADWK